MKFLIPEWLMDWVKEGINRLRMKRPKFFRNLSRVGDVAIMLTGLPWGLHQAELTWHFTVPDALTALSSKMVTGIGIGLKIASMLTVKTIPIAQTVSGEPITVVDKYKMPFTAKTEAKEIEKIDPPPPIVQGVSEPQK